MEGTLGQAAKSLTIFAPRSFASLASFVFPEVY